MSLSSATAAATIYYTIDGSMPDSNATMYMDSITLTDSATVNAVAIAEGFNDSEVTSQTYTIVPADTN